MAKQQLLVTYPLPDDLVKRIRDTLGFDSIEYRPAKFVPGSTHPKAFWSYEPAEIPEDVWKETTVLLTMFFVPESRAQAPNLKFVQGMTAGLEHLLSAPVFREAPDLIVATASGVHSTNIGEYVIMQSLNAFHKQSVLRDIQENDRMSGRTKYVPAGSVRGSPELRGHIMGIIGYGCIGRECGRLANAFGMTVLAASSSGEQASAQGFTVEGTGDPDGNIPKAWFSSKDTASLKDFLGQIDILVLACPLTDATRKLISDKTIRYLKKSAYLINIARGPVVDHEALYTALEEERIAGAILDVTDPEPLPANDKLWTAKNCTITPHISGSGMHYESRCIDVLEVNLKRIADGKGPLNVVSLARGY